jgi:hypothetical protein
MQQGFAAGLAEIHGAKLSVEDLLHRHIIAVFADYVFHRSGHYKNFIASNARPVAMGRTLVRYHRSPYAIVRIYPDSNIPRGPLQPSAKFPLLPKLNRD